MQPEAFYASRRRRKQNDKQRDGTFSTKDYEFSRQTLIMTRLNSQHRFHMGKSAWKTSFNFHNKVLFVQVYGELFKNNKQSFVRALPPRLSVVHKIEIIKVIAKIE